MKNLQNEIEKLKAEQNEINKRTRKRREQMQADKDRYHKIENEIHTLRIKQLAGVPNAVVMRSRYPAAMKESKLNNLFGTLITLRRTRGTVDFGDAGKWNVPLIDLLPAEQRDQQGGFVCL